MNNANIIENILRREGDRYTNNPLDRGGATKYGVTQRAWNDYISHDPANAPCRDVEALTRDMAIKFYTDSFVEPVSWIDNVYLRELVIDSAVQHGPMRAIKWLQAAASCTIDGVIGDETRRAVNPLSDSLADTEWQLHIYHQMLKTRVRFYAQIASDGGPNDTDLHFLPGWINRVAEFIR